MLVSSLLLITNHGLFPILLGWLLGAAVLAGSCAYNRSRIRRGEPQL